MTCASWSPNPCNNLNSLLISSIFFMACSCEADIDMVNNNQHYVEIDKVNDQHCI